MWTDEVNETEFGSNKLESFIPQGKTYISKFDGHWKRRSSVVPWLRKMLVLAEDPYESKWYILRDTKVIISHCTTALTKLYHVYVNLSQKLRKIWL